MAANQERNFAREAAALLRAARSGTLATTQAGRPHAALVTPALGPDGLVLLLLSELSAHTSHLRADPRCALLVTGVAADANPQTTPRLSLRGTAHPTGMTRPAPRICDIILTQHCTRDLRIFIFGRSGLRKRTT